MEVEKSSLDIDRIIKQIRVAISIALLAGGSYLGYETFTIAKSILVEPTSQKKWLDLRPMIMQEPVATQANANPKNSPKLEETEINPMTLWVGLGYFSILLGILYLYVLARISLALITSGTQILTNLSKK